MSRRILIWLISLAFAGVVAFGLYTLCNSRTHQTFGDLAARVETDKPIVALTFDDGPTARFTDEVLGILDELGVKATFFVTGREVTENPAEAKAIVAAGHELGNHSYSHPRMVLKSYATYQSEIEKTDVAIRAIGYDGHLHFRPPFGKKLFGLPWYLSSTGRTTITWDVEPDSYPAVADDVDAYVEHVVEQTRSGSIILMHVMSKSRAVSREALPGIITQLRDRGFDFVTVSELLQERG